MNASLPKITSPELTPEEKQGLQDYWQVYEAHREEVNVEIAKVASSHPEFKGVMQDPAAQPTPEQRARNFEIQRNAVLHQEWQPYLSNLQLQGMGYAHGGISFRAWFELIDAFRKSMMPHLVATYGNSMELLLSAVNGMDTLISIVMQGMGEAYLETKEQLIRAQESAVQDAVKRAQNEKRFRGLLEAAPDGMVVVDNEGTIVMVNAQMEKLFGYNRAEVVGKRVETLIPLRFKDIHPFHRGQYTKSSRPRPMGADLELYALRKDGAEFPVEISLSPVESEEEQLIIAAIRDITERKRAEEKFRGLLESAPDSMVVVDQKGVIQL